ncbi:heparinase II/III family protein [Oceanicella sp. SM1341]|uniref:heparinase II/III family protein n=1 Tax=Oceanicella sp. SM1341 TaxID=1548889 RepID=UPI000E4B65BA|nr:heparinase II/III family protein [Oceanicella sp. SM1341]
MAGLVPFLRRQVRRLALGRARAVNAWRARASVLARVPAQAGPGVESRAIGSFERGRALAGGEIALAGHSLRHDGPPWSLTPPDTAFRDALHGFDWVEDLAAAGDARARRTLAAWVADWDSRYGSGSGPGWAPGLAGRRMIHLSCHLGLLTATAGEDTAAIRRLLRSLARQERYLARAWGAAAPGAERFEALAGLVFVTLALGRPLARLQERARLFGAECARAVGPDGGIASRSPEELLEVFTLMVRTERALEEAGRLPDPRHREAVVRAAPTLRALRMGDGALARFHGGGRGGRDNPGQLDRALVDSGARGRGGAGLAMGFARLQAGRTTLVLDAAPPPGGAHAGRAHASTLGLEISVGRRPLVGSLGPGAQFGEEWRRACRATGSHSALVVEHVSSARFTGADPVLGDRLTDPPAHVEAERVEDPSGLWLQTAHDGYVAPFGLVHQRRLFLAPDGLDLRGEDTLTATTEAQRARFAAAVEGAPRLGLAFSAIFHLHPDVEAESGPAANAVTLRLPSGETWIFRQSGGALELAESVFIDQERLEARETKQVVVTSRAVEYGGRVTWAFRRAEDGAPSTRDVVTDSAPAAGPPDPG